MDWASLIAVVLAALAWSQARERGPLARRIAELERQVAALRLARPQPGAAPPPAPEPAPAPAPIAATRPQPRPETLPIPRSGPPPRAAPARPPISVAVDWERWLGVRGAAVLGGVVLALAGLFFFRYSIEHGLIPPWLRVVLGAAVGAACVAASEWRMRTRYAGTANALAGAGVVILFAAFWAAHALYALIGVGLAFTGMIATTVACSALSWRHASLVIALLGLAGGFATPLLLATNADRPIGLFGYLLVLDLGMLVLGIRRGWPILAWASLAGTALYEVFWLAWRMGPERLGLGLAILGVFALVFAIAGRAAPAERRREFLVAQAGGVLFPFAFAVYLAVGTRFGVHLYPLALLLVPLSLAANWIAREQQRPELGLGAASAAIGVAAVWISTRHLDAALAWELSAVAFAFVLTPHLFVERESPRPISEGAGPAAAIAGVGFGLLLLAAPAQNPSVSLWPWLTGWLAIAGLLLRQGGLAGRGFLQPLAAFGVASGLAHFAAQRAASPGHPTLAGVAASLVAVALLFQLVALARARTGADPWSEHAAALLAVVAALALGEGGVARALAWPIALGAALALGVLAALCSTRLRSGAWGLAAMVATACAHWAWSGQARASDAAPHALLGALALQSCAVLVFTAWPFAAGGRLARDRWARYASALAAPAWFPSLLRLFELRFGDAAIGLLPAALGALALVAALRVQRALPAGDAGRRRGLVWHLAVALGFATAAIPLQLEREWITIGWALEGLALVMLWRRLDHPGLKWVALALLGAVTVRLVANPALLGYHARSGWPVLNWLLYTYLVPAASLLAASRALAPEEVERARGFERPLYAAGRPVAAIAAGVAGLVVIFVWINLAIFDFYAQGPELRLRFERASARDLTMSIAWAVYALALLAAGVRRASRGLRWASLVLVMITVAKVFLYDLGELRDLYRVASLLGLAVSLITISLAYQRFVLRRPGAGAE